MLDIAQQIKHFQSDKTENEILRLIKHPIHQNEEWLNRNTYLTYYAIGHILRPKSICEIGSLAGYSLESIFLGSGLVKHIFSYDNEQDIPGSCNHIFERYKIEQLDTLQIHGVNTRDITTLNMPIEVDMAIVDGQHSLIGAYHDCLLVSRHLKDGGFLLVDDIVTGKDAHIIKSAVDQFCYDFELTPQIIESYHGMYLIEYKKNNITREMVAQKFQCIIDTLLCHSQACQPAETIPMLPLELGQL